MPCEVWQRCPLRQRKSRESCLCFGIMQRSRWTVHMHEVGGCQPITLTLAMGLWPWESMEDNGTSLSYGVKASSGGWEKWLSLKTPVSQAGIEPVEECRSALQHLLGHMQFMLVNDGWRGRWREEMPQRHLCVWSRCLMKRFLGKEHRFQRGMVGKKKKLYIVHFILRKDNNS